MGSTGTLTRAEAAEILGVSMSTLTHMLRDGHVRAKEYDGNKALFDEEEVHALKEAREMGSSPQQLLEMTRQAWAAARIAQRKVEYLERLLGMHVPPANQLSEEGVRALHAEAEEALEQRLSSADKVNYWADKFFSICDAYLARVKEVIGIDDPWLLYLRLSDHLVMGRDFVASQLDPAEIIAYKRLHAGREQFRRAAFTYLLQRFGKQKAFKVFPTEFDGYHHDVMLHALGGDNLK